MEREKKRPKRKVEGINEGQEIDGGATALPMEKHRPPEEELSVDPDDLGKHTLENATEAPEEK